MRQDAASLLPLSKFSPCRGDASIAGLITDPSSVPRDLRFEHGRVDDGSHAVRSLRAYQSTRMPADLMTFAHLSCSLRMNAANSAGELLVATSPPTAYCAFTSASASARASSACNLAMVGCGVPAAAT